MRINAIYCVKFIILIDLNFIYIILCNFYKKKILNILYDMYLYIFKLSVWYLFNIIN